MRVRGSVEPLEFREGKMKGTAPRAVQVFSLHIVCDGAMPWRDGAISAPSDCAAAIFVAPDCRSPGEALSRVMGTPIRGDRNDHGA